MKKKISFIRLMMVIMLAMTMFPSTNAFAAKKPKVPSQKKLQVICDSLLQEGLRLYAYEKMAWVSSDSLFKYCEHKDEIGGFNLVCNDKYLKYIYSDETRTKILFECTLDLDLVNKDVSKAPFNTTWSNQVRSATDEEKTLLEERATCLNKALEAYGDSMYLASAAQGSLNFNVVRIHPHVIRVYCLQGTSITNMIPIGNDYVIDMDSNHKILAFQRLHHSFLPTKVNRGQNMEVVHSHTTDNPFITPTDICTALLYGRDLMGVTRFGVLSTAFKEMLQMTFDTKKLTIDVQTVE